MSYGEAGIGAPQKVHDSICPCGAGMSQRKRCPSIQRVVRRVGKSRDHIPVVVVDPAHGFDNTAGLAVLRGFHVKLLFERPSNDDLEREEPALR
jgi:hypothetical protein